jgi:O-antigen/teichoic acid export membrane protein
MDMGNSKGTIISSLFWKFGERVIAQGVSFVVTIIIARILLPEEYGAVSLVLVFINLADVLVTSGFNTALIQKKDSTTKEYSTILYCSIAVSLGVYALLYFLAPVFSDFYKMPILSPVIRVMGLRLIIGSYNSIQHAYVSHHMLFKRFFFSTLFGTIVSAIVGIVMAYKGFGTWALVAQYMTNSFIDTAVLFITIKWKPTLEFSFCKARELLKYAWKITAGELLSAGYNDLRSMIIGKVYSAADLAYYSRGEQFPKLITQNINTSIISVLFPAISNINDDRLLVKQFTKKAIRTSSFVIFPLMAGMMAVAKNLVLVLLKEKWLFCVPFLQLSCITYAFIPINSANIQATKAIGRSDLFLKTEIIKKSIGILSIIMCMRISVMAIAISSVVVNLIAIFVNVGANVHTLQYGYFEQAKDLLPALLSSILMGVGVFFVGRIAINPIICLAIQIVFGVLSYITLSKIMKIPEYTELKYYCKKLIDSRFRGVKE